jgi:hypothetical protein
MEISLEINDVKLACVHAAADGGAAAADGGFEVDAHS